MELYAKKASVLFVPFRNIDELKPGGQFLPNFKEAVISNVITDNHCRILQNIQDSRNSLNAGQTKDALERETEEPSRSGAMHIDDGTENMDELFEEMMSDLRAFS